ncbi:MAG: acyltransferase [Chloroflexota bacterium]
MDNTISGHLHARLLGVFGARVGKHVYIRGGLRVLERFDFTLGDGEFVGDGCTFDCSAPIRVGSRVFIAYGVTIVTGTHAIGPRECRADAFTPRGVTIGDGCWIGARAIILPGVHIGDGVVVGAGSVVTRDVAPDTVVAGNPARLVRSLEQPGREGRSALEEDSKLRRPAANSLRLK